MQRGFFELKVSFPYVFSASPFLSGSGGFSFSADFCPESAFEIDNTA